MMAVPRSATRALGRWSWKHTHDVIDTREGKDTVTLKNGFGMPMATTEETKRPESPVEHEVAASIIRLPTRFVGKRGPEAGGEKDAIVREENDAGRVATPTQTEDNSSMAASRSDTPSVDSEMAEHVVVPCAPPKPHVLVKSLVSKRAAPMAGTVENGIALKEIDVSEVPSGPNEYVGVDENSDDVGKAPQHNDRPVDPNGGVTPVEAAVPDTPSAPSTSSSQIYHMFPVCGVTPPNGTRFIEDMDAPLELTETRTTVVTEPVIRPTRPQRRISLRSFGFFYGKDSRPAHAFPAYIPPTERVVYEADEAEEDAAPSYRSRPNRKRNDSRISLLSPHKPTLPGVTKGDRGAIESALSLRTLIIGPAALDVRDREKSKGVESKPSAALRKVNQKLLVPSEANRVIAVLRELPPPDLPPAAAQTVETVGKKKGWMFARRSSREEVKYDLPKESAGTVAVPIHGCCLDTTDEEAEDKHFSKLTGSGFAGPRSAVGTKASANAGSADLSSLVLMLKNLHLVNLQASPDLSSVNAASLSAQITTPDLGFGQPADKVPSTPSLADSMEKVGQTLMSLGFATAAVLPPHVGVRLPKDRMSVLTYWWGYEIVFPPPTMRYLSHVNSISSALLNFLTAFALFSNGVREMLPFIRCIAQFIDFEWNMIKAQDKGRGVVCAATWVVPAAVVPRPWDFIDPPMNDKVPPGMVPGPTTQDQSMPSMPPAGPVSQKSIIGLTEPAAEAGETNMKKASHAETRNEEPLAEREDGQEDRQEDEQKGTETDATQEEIVTTSLFPRCSEESDTRDD